MSQYDMRRIGDLATITSSKRIFLSDYVEKGVPFWRSKEVIEQFNGNEISNELFISFDKYLNIKNQFGVPAAGDILITSVGTIGIPYLVKDDDLFYFKDGNLTWIKGIKQDISPIYLFNWIASPLGKAVINNYLIGSSQKALTIESLKKIPIPLPPLPTQQKIAHILSAYDDLIENNLKRIKLLEEMAQITCEQWFVRMKFPGYETTPLDAETGLPVGWVHKAVGSLLKHEIGGGWGNDELSQEFSEPGFVIRGTDFDGLTKGDKSGIPFRFHKKSNLASRKLQHGDIIFEVSGGSHKAGVAKTVLFHEDLLKQLNKNVICASFCKLARPDNVISAYLLFHFFRFLRRIKATEVFEIRSASNIVNYNWTAFLKYQQIPIPTQDVLQKFYQLAAPIHKQLYQLGRQNQLLKEARDILLPRLMTGMIDVDHIELPKSEPATVAA